ncbi:hypothetical protein AGMMS50267_15830 [Spirochaetia bacterium]|nr:hypothetical protein AGMMS50267_15830 [Spirochaetia bacterium]
MKQSRVLTGIFGLVLVFGLMVSGCPQTEGDSKNTEASVTAIKVGSVDVVTVPALVPAAVFTGEDFAVNQLDAAQIGQAVLAQTSDLANAAISVTASSGAKLKYAAARTVNDLTFGDSNTVTLENLGYLFLQVTAEDGNTVNYYVVRITTLNTVTTLTGVTVAGKEVTLAVQGDTYTGAALGGVGLSNTEKTNAPIAVTRFNPNQTVKFAKVTGTGAPSFGADTSFTFADGDFLYIEVTAENGTNKGIYKVEVQISRDTTLSVLNIGGTVVESPGTPAATLAGVTAGTVLLTNPGTGHAIIATPTDSEATVTWAAGASDPVDGAFVTTSPLTFVDGQYLYVKVVAGNGTTTAYYKVQVNLLMTATIKYGAVDIQPSVNKFIDPLWASVTETYRIEKIYGTDSDDAWEAAQAAAPTAYGVAKALFDEDGLYVYVEITDPNVDTTGTSAHLKDSVELFINEAVNGSNELIKTPAGYADKGGQYRVDAADGVSSDPAVAVVTKHSAWTKTGGYVVIFQAPWRFKDQYPVTANKKIGFELQINACSNGNRDGVLVWNNIAHGNYQNVTDFGEATLDLNGHTLAVNAKNPTITANPVGKLYQPGVSVVDLTVGGTSPDGGTVTYQWYSNTANSYTDGAAVGTGATYTPSTTADGVTTYYWAAVINTIADNSDGGTKTATVNSTIAAVRFSSVALVEKIVAGGSSIPVYGFTLPAGDTWGDYTKWTYTLLVADTVSYEHTAGRGTIAGNYPASNFATGVYSQGNWGGERIVDIPNAATLKDYLGDPGLNVWVPREVAIPATGGSVPAAGATGHFYFGIGLTLNQNSLAEGSKGDTIAYYIKDVALENADGSKRVYADDLVSFWCKFHVDFGSVTRTLEANPAP